MLQVAFPPDLRLSISESSQVNALFPHGTIHLFKLLLNVKAYFPNVFQQHIRIGTNYCFQNKKSKSFVLKVAERKNYVIPKGSIHLENAVKRILIKCHLFFFIRDVH